MIFGINERKNTMNNGSKTFYRKNDNIYTYYRKYLCPVLEFKEYLIARNLHIVSYTQTNESGDEMRIRVRRIDHDQYI